jgi:nitrous oxidase accessory protein NosD
MMRLTSAAIIAASIVTLTACAATGTPAPTPTTGSSSVAADQVPECPAATVDVTTADELQTALDAAEPGDVIQLADGTYDGGFTATASGSEEQPIHLCGGGDAILDGGGIETGPVLHLDGATHWTILGFQLQNGQKGLMADATEGTVLGGLTIRDIGDEAIHLRAGSSDNLVVGNSISGTGLRRAEFGEGVYVGSAEEHWCDVSDCEPDASDRNRIVGNDISETTAEAIDVKEGTTGGEISGNTFDGSGMTEADSWVDVKGSDWLISGNTGRSSPQDGFQTHEIVDGWGTGNRFIGNSAQVDGPGYGFALTPPLENTISCDNQVAGAALGLANIDCTD